jgi:hypothetical protein
MSHGLLVALMILAILCSLISLVAGIICIVRYFRTRKTALLIIGLVLTLIVPGILLCIAITVGIPATFMVYGPSEAFRP